MGDSRARLEAVRFAESRHARAAGDLAKADVVDAVERFLDACYRDAGAAPDKLDGDQLREIALVHLPRRCYPKEPFVPRLGAILAAFFDHLEETTLVPQLFEIRRTLAEIADEIPKTVRAVPDAERRTDDKPVAPLRRPSEKIGRNDPCPCGSGKKYKNCCLRLSG
jgi:SEC-C motif-containing protein